MFYRNKTPNKMARPFRVGDFVLIGFDDSSSYYQGYFISNDGIFIMTDL